MAHKLKVIPLGGLLEIGKNLTVIEYGNDIVIIDAGLAFPDEEMLGVDMVIPDFTYLRTSKKKVRALILTHGHEDHIGAIPYLMTEVNCPIFCTPLTAGLVELKLAEHKMLSLCKINRVRPGDRVDIGVGAKIIGDITIADDVKIGAGAVVTKSCLKQGATLVGIPAKILPEK